MNVIVPTFEKAGSHFIRAIVYEILGRPKLFEPHPDTNMTTEWLSRNATPFMGGHMWRLNQDCMLWFADRGYRAIVGIRDPKDVLVSKMHFIKYKRPKPDASDMLIREMSDEEALIALLEGTPVDRPQYLYKYLRWWNRMQELRSWIPTYVTRYEQLVEDPLAEISEIARQLKVECNADRVNEKTRYSSQHHIIHEGGKRKGIVGDWKNHFTPKVMNAYIRNGGSEIEAAMAWY